MRISFDLDGVVANSEKWFFSMLETTNASKSSIEILYYVTRSVKYNPYNFLTSGDQGYIITARKPHAQKVTNEWLENKGISLPVIYVDTDNDIDWTNYIEASIKSGTRKAEIIESRGVLVHFDNNPYTVMVIRKELPDVRVIAVGGEPCLSYM